jgi:DNA helicase II / ATP-dependent DNA helicase PcrA
VIKNELKLNPRQLEAISFLEGPLLIVAGAGSGKTKTIVARISRLLEKGVAPENILALTFTNKAAREMAIRANPGTIDISHKLTVTTFHSLGAQILRTHHKLVDLNRYFQILDRDQSLTRIKKAIKNFSGYLSEKDQEPRYVLSVISHFKSRGLSPEDIKDQGNSSTIINSLWPAYEKILNQEGAVDFDDLLAKTVRLFLDQPKILESYQNRWQYIHIDEYQDTNEIQYTLSKLLAQKHCNLCAVGDADQSIYSWRGADYKNILKLEKDFPNLKIITLEENYRSTKTIIEAANAIIAKNKNRKPKNLTTTNQAGEAIGIFAGLDEEAEALFVAGQVKKLLNQGFKPTDIAVLYRANFQSRALEQAFWQLNLPYQVAGVRFFARQEIKDLLAFVTAAVNPKNEESLTRAISQIKGLGKKTVTKILVGDNIDTFPKSKQEIIKNFQQLLKAITQKIETCSPVEVLSFVFKASGLEDNLAKLSDAKERQENIKELLFLAKKYNRPDGLFDLLADAALATDQDSIQDGRGGIRLMTVHAAKGLEFKVIFVTGLEEDLFPYKKENNGKGDDPEEERRLFYVAITRAKEKLFLTYAQTRGIFGNRRVNLPSEFILDLDSVPLKVEEMPNSETTKTIIFYD